MGRFVTVSTKCPHCGKSTPLQLEQTWAPPEALIKRLAGTRMRCRNRQCARIFDFNPEDAVVKESKRI